MVGSEEWLLLTTLHLLFASLLLFSLPSGMAIRHIDNPQRCNDGFERSLCLRTGGAHGR